MSTVKDAIWFLFWMAFTVVVTLRLIFFLETL